MDLHKHTPDSETMDLGIGTTSEPAYTPASDHPVSSPTSTPYTPKATDSYSSPAPGAYSYGPEAAASPLSPIDENDITINDKKSPVVLLVGPPASGKSMSLVRLARYLRDAGYTITPDLTFKSDPSYKARCEKFMANLNTKEALEGTALNEFLLVKVVKDGRTICQILEAPGEHYFSSSNTGGKRIHDFPPYLTKIIRTLPNRKLWLFITEAQWEVHATVKSSYVDMIRSCKDQLLNHADRVVLLYNKVDKQDHLFKGGKVILSAAERAMKEEYPALADIFKNPNPITSLWNPYNYTFVPFCSGYYHQMVGGRESYTESEKRYPEMLWENLLKCIRG